MTTYAMVIDLKRCVGCGACVISCKNENNVQEGMFWANIINRTVGKFPDVRYDVIPTLCNHCGNAPCVNACPTTAMHKIDGGITMHDPDKCIGCRYCMAACPYGVINYNQEEPHQFWREGQALMESTSAPAEVTEKVGGTVIPYYNPDREATLPGIRPKGVVEKCTFCDHRVKVGELPYCVEACPANARIFGDLDDPNSEVNRILGKNRPFRLREELGAEPRVYYVKSFSAGVYKKTKGEV